MSESDSDVQVICGRELGGQCGASQHTEFAVDVTTDRLAKRRCLGNAESLPVQSVVSGGDSAARMASSIEVTGERKAFVADAASEGVVLPVSSATCAGGRSQAGKGRTSAAGTSGLSGGAVYGHVKELQGVKALRVAVRRNLFRLKCRGVEGLAAPSRRRPRKRKVAAEEAVVKAVEAGDSSAVPRPQEPLSERRCLVLDRLRSALVGNFIMGRVDEAGACRDTSTGIDLSEVDEGWQVEMAKGGIGLVLAVAGAGSFVRNVRCIWMSRKRTWCA